MKRYFALRAVFAPASAWLLALAGCAGSPPDTISLAGTQATVPAVPPATGGGLATEAVKWKRSKPGCTGQCPTLEVDSVRFPGDQALTALVERAMVELTGLDPDRPRPYATVAEYEQYFWRTAGPRDETVLQASVKRQSGDLVVLQIDSYQYTGGAHGVPATQYLNCLRSRQQVLSLEDVLVPGQRAAYGQALRRAHQRWLQTNTDAQQDPSGYARLWPFQESDNFALGENGLIVKYSAYSIAPYSHGEPELAIPYDELQGVLKPEYLPRPA